MMKRAIFNIIVIFFLALPILFFQSCPIPGGKKAETVIAHKPTWAVNKAGNILVEIVDLDPKIEYNPLEGFNNTYSVVCKSSIYSGENKVYNVNYRILSSVTIEETRGSCTIKDAEYDIVRGQVHSIVEEAGSYELKIPKGLEALQTVNVIIEYNVSNLLTKIRIPMTVRRPATGSTSTQEVPIYYTASPIIPRSDKIKVDITSKNVIFYLDIVDAGGCFSGYRRPPRLKIGEDIRINVIAAGSNLDISCIPATISILPATIRCSIDLTKNRDAYNLFSSESGLYLEISANLTYNCSMRKSYTVQVVRQI